MFVVVVTGGPVVEVVGVPVVEVVVVGVLVEVGGVVVAPFPRFSAA